MFGPVQHPAHLLAQLQGGRAHQPRRLAPDPDEHVRPAVQDVHPFGVQQALQLHPGKWQTESGRQEVADRKLGFFCPSMIPQERERFEVGDRAVNVCFFFQNPLFNQGSSTENVGEQLLLGRERDQGQSPRSYFSGLRAMLRSPPTEFFLHVGTQIHLPKFHSACLYGQQGPKVAPLQLAVERPTTSLPHCKLYQSSHLPVSAPGERQASACSCAPRRACS